MTQQVIPLHEYTVMYEPAESEHWPYRIYLEGRFENHTATLKGAKRWIKGHKRRRMTESHVVYREPA